MKRAIAVAALALSILYACDYFSVRFRIPAGREPLGTVQIRRYYAIPLKNGKTEFTSAGSETQACVHSLFPHLGRNPCWYLNRNKRKTIKM